MKPFAKGFGYLLILLSCWMVYAAVRDLVLGKQSPGMMIGLIVFWCLASAAGIWLVRRMKRVKGDSQATLPDAVQERDAMGNPVYVHKTAAPNRGDIAHADDERICAHCEAVLGKSEMVWHELVSDRVHIDVHLYAPTPERPYNVLVTSGMSAIPMTVPSDVKDRDSWRHAELCILLAPEWKLNQADFNDERNYWPVRLLKSLARMPHNYATWLDWGHSIPNGDPAAPYAEDTRLSGAILIPPLALGNDFFIVKGEPSMHVFQVLPVAAAEMAYKLAHGVDALLEKLEAVFPNLYEAVDPQRESVC